MEMVVGLLIKAQGDGVGAGGVLCGGTCGIFTEGVGRVCASGEGCSWQEQAGLVGPLARRPAGPVGAGVGLGARLSSFGDVIVVFSPHLRLKDYPVSQHQVFQILPSLTLVS